MPHVVSFKVTDAYQLTRKCQASNCPAQAVSRVRWLVADGASTGKFRARFLCERHTRRWLDTHFEQRQLFPA